MYGRSHLSKLVEGTIVLGNVVLLQVHNGVTIVHASEGDSRIDFIPGYVAMAIIIHLEPPLQGTQQLNSGRPYLIHCTGYKMLLN